MEAVDNQNFFNNDPNFRAATLKPISKRICYKKLTEAAPDIWIIDNQIDKDVCQEIITKFEECDEKRQGVVGDGRVDLSIKNSVDFMIPTGDIHWAKVDDILFKSLNAAKEQILNQLKHWMTITEGLFEYDTGYQIQKTLPGGRYIWHTETQGLMQAERTLVFTWYLNEVEKGGHTGFVRQGVSVEPRPGRLVCFSPYWTHIHAGLPVEAGVKYLITGWIHAG